jgi:hypothetical protein
MMGSSPTNEVLGGPQRRRFRVWQRCMDASRFVLLDEIGTAINMTHRYGKPPREQRGLKLWRMGTGDHHLRGGPA